MYEWLNRFWICNWIYWTLTDPWLQVIITVLLIHTLYCSLEHTRACCGLTSLLVMVSNGRHSSSSGFPNCPRPQLPAFNRNSSQWLNLSSSLNHQPTHTTPLTALLIAPQHGPCRKHRSCFCLWAIVCLFCGRSLATGLHSTLFTFRALTTMHRWKRDIRTNF
jgi:hypothetical protein